MQDLAILNLGEMQDFAILGFEVIHKSSFVYFNPA